MHSDAALRSSERHRATKQEASRDPGTHRRAEINLEVGNHIFCTASFKSYATLDALARDMRVSGDLIHVHRAQCFARSVEASGHSARQSEARALCSSVWKLSTFT